MTHWQITQVQEQHQNKRRKFDFKMLSQYSPPEGGSPTWTSHNLLDPARETTRPMSTQSIWRGPWHHNKIIMIQTTEICSKTPPVEVLFDSMAISAFATRSKGRSKGSLSLWCKDFLLFTATCSATLMSVSFEHTPGSLDKWHLTQSTRRSFQIQKHIAF